MKRTLFIAMILSFAAFIATPFVAEAQTNNYVHTVKKEEVAKTFTYKGMDVKLFKKYALYTWLPSNCFTHNYPPACLCDWTCTVITFHFASGSGIPIVDEVSPVSDGNCPYSGGYPSYPSPGSGTWCASRTQEEIIKDLILNAEERWTEVEELKSKSTK